MRDDNFFADKRLVHTSKPGQVIVPTMGKTFHPQLREQMRPLVTRRAASEEVRSQVQLGNEVRNRGETRLRLKMSP